MAFALSPFAHVWKTNDRTQFLTGWFQPQGQALVNKAEDIGK